MTPQVSLYMAHDCLGFNSIPFNAFQIFSLIKAFVNEFVRSSQDLAQTIDIIQIRSHNIVFYSNEFVFSLIMTIT